MVEEKLTFQLQIPFENTIIGYHEGTEILTRHIENGIDCYKPDFNYDNSFSEEYKSTCGANITTVILRNGNMTPSVYLPTQNVKELFFK